MKFYSHHLPTTNYHKLERTMAPTPSPPRRLPLLSVLLCRNLVVVDAVLAAAGVWLVALRVHSQQGDLYHPVENFILVRNRCDRTRSLRTVHRHDRRLQTHLQQGELDFRIRVFLYTLFHAICSSGHRTQPLTIHNKRYRDTLHEMTDSLHTPHHIQGTNYNGKKTSKDCLTVLLHP